MSYWETLLVILRRWPLSVPAILISIGLGVAAFVVSPPQYKDTTQILFIGSSIQAGDKTQVRVNPYLGLGSGLVQTAAVIQATVSTPQVADDLAKEGATGLYLVAADTSTPAPVLLVTVTAADSAVARKTTNAVVKKINDELLRVQQRANAPANQYIETTPISALPKPVRSIVAQVRPAITASAGFFALAMFVLFLLEGRRQRKRRSNDASQAPAGVGPDRADFFEPVAGPADHRPFPQPARSPQYQTPARPPQYQQPATPPQYQQPAAQPQYQQPAAQPQYQQPAAAPQYQQPLHPAADFPAAAAHEPRPSRLPQGPQRAVPQLMQLPTATPAGGQNGRRPAPAEQYPAQPAPNGAPAADPRYGQRNGVAPNGAGYNGHNGAGYNGGAAPNGHNGHNGSDHNGAGRNGSAPAPAFGDIIAPQSRTQNGTTWNAPTPQGRNQNGTAWNTPPEGEPFGQAAPPQPHPNEAARRTREQIDGAGSPGDGKRSWFDFDDEPRGAHDRRN